MERRVGKQSSDLSMKEIKARKDKLDREIDEIEQRLESRMNKVQRTVLGTLKPLSAIRDNPFKAVGTAVLVGFILGLPRRKKSAPGITKSRFHALLFDELKRIAARKAVEYTSDFMDEKIASARKSSSKLQK